LYRIVSYQVKSTTNNQLVPVSRLPGRRRLRSSFTLQLHITQYRLSTAGRRSFPVAASIFWNTLPDDVQSAPCVSSFRRQLKTSVVVLKESPCPRGFSRTNFQVLVLVLELQVRVRVLVLGAQFLSLSLFLSSASEFQVLENFRELSIG